MMKEAIKNFPQQFKYRPVIINKNKLADRKKFIVLGMGGSNLAPELLKMRDPFLDIHSHRNYGLPKIPSGVLRESLVIASSYSGNTEETVDGFQEARKRRLSLAAIATGGKLLVLAKKYRIPYIQLPATDIQPRMALGYATLGLTALMNLRSLEKELRELESALDVFAAEKKGKLLAKKMFGRAPVIYSSLNNAAIAYNWKIKFNETGKTPAFANNFPELNHNEMAGFGTTGAARNTSNVSNNFHFVFLSDKDDRPQIRKRMALTARLYRKRGLPVEIIPLSGPPTFRKIFNSLLLADWTAYHTAKIYKAESEKVSLIEELKKLMKR